MKPWRLVAATAKMPAQLAGRATALPSLPAAATMNTPRLRSSVIASAYSRAAAATSGLASVRLHDVPCTLAKPMTSTLAGLGLAGTPDTARPAAQRMPSTMSATDAPHLPDTRTGRMRAFQLMPATPLALLVTAPSCPATSVPCQLLLGRTTQPSHNAVLALNSACVSASPGSLAPALRPVPPLFAYSGLLTKL